MEKNIRNKLQTIWNKDLINSKPDYSLINDLFEFIDKKYSEPWRHYHNQKHILYMLNKLDEFILKDNKYFIKHNIDLKILCTAICLHDVIYDSWSLVNEQASADFAKMFVKVLSNESKNIEDVEKLILSTKHLNKKNITESEALIRDLDIFNFVEIDTPLDRFKLFQEIRAEYFFLSIEEFLAGRIKLIEDFFNREKIFLSKIFSKYELTVKENLKNYLIEMKTYLRK